MKRSLSTEPAGEARGPPGQLAIDRTPVEGIGSNLLGDDERLAIVAGQHGVGLGIADELFGGRVELELTAEAVGDVAKVGQARAVVRGLDRAVEDLGSRLANRIDEVGEMLADRVAVLALRPGSPLRPLNDS